MNEIKTIDDLIEYLKTERNDWKNFECYEREDSTAKSTAIGMIGTIHNKVLELKANMDKQND